MTILLVGIFLALLLNAAGVWVIVFVLATSDAMAGRSSVSPTEERE